MERKPKSINSRLLHKENKFRTNPTSKLLSVKCELDILLTETSGNDIIQPDKGLSR